MPFVESGRDLLAHQIGDTMTDPAVLEKPWTVTVAYRRNPTREMKSEYLDRARSGYYTPGSSFKIVTAKDAKKFLR